MFGGTVASIQLTSLELALKKIVRILSFSLYLEDSHPLFVKLKLLNVKKINKYMSLLFVFKSIRNDNIFFVYSYPNNVYSNRATTFKLLETPIINTFHSRQSISWTGVKLWNWLPEDIRGSVSYSAFNNFRLKHFLLEAP